MDPSLDGPVPAPPPSFRSPVPAAPRPVRGRRRIALVLVAVLTIVATAFAFDVLVPGAPVAIALAPDFAKLGPGAVAVFHPQIVDARGHMLAPPLAWTSDGGAVDATGTLTAPTKAGSYRVTATTANGLSATANVLVEPGPASAIEVTTGATIKPSESAAVTAVVRDSFGNAIEPANVTWSVSPATATIDTDGTFRSRTAGTYAVAARSGEVTGTTNVVVACPQTHPDTYRGATFSVVCGTTGDVWIAGTISARDTATILATIDRDVRDLERDLNVQMQGRFRMFTYATSASFASTLSTLFPGATGDITGVYVPPDSIVVDWQGANSEVPEDTIRHELTHLLVQRASGRLGAREIPAWFDEGFATVEQYAVPGSAWQATSDRYCAASAAAIGAMPSLAAMTSLRDFQALDGRLGYIVGAQAVQLLKDEMGLDGIRKMLTAVGIGHHWDDAYREASGRSWDDFTAAFAARVRAFAPRYPDVAFAPDTPVGAGVAYVAYGYDAASAIRVNVESARFGGGGTRTTSSAGCAVGYLDSTWPSGTYTFTASGRAGTVQTTLRK